MDKEKQTLAILAAWNIYEQRGRYYTYAMHNLYIKEISRLFSKVIMLAPVKFNARSLKINSLQCIEEENVQIYPLPYYERHLDALKYFFVYKKVVLEVSVLADVFYCRVPDPFAWMPATLTDKPVIMHFVGDAVHATQNNIYFSYLKKKVLLFGYWFENKLIERSAKRSTVYCNGEHITKSLISRGIDAHTIVSSTIKKKYFASQMSPLSNKPLKIIYVGFLRYAKGIDTLIAMLNILDEKGFDYEMHVVGEGEMKDAIEEYKASKGSKNIFLYGHIDDRSRLLSMLRESDLFFFPSLSEGSPRVVIEAMSQGCPVLSTPVGSLPSTFVVDEEILFFPFNGYKEAAEKIIDMGRDLGKLDQIRTQAYQRVKSDFSMEKFIQTITTIHE